MENKTKHSPGPWKVVHRSFIEAVDGLMVAQISVNGTYSEADANAKLIAAAPDLLKFAKKMFARYENSEWIANEAKELIKNATE